MVDQIEPAATPRPAPRRTRKAEVISGITVVLSIPLLTFAWNIYKDVQEFKRLNNSDASRQLEGIRSYCDSKVESEHQRAKEAETELEKRQDGQEKDIREIRTHILNQRPR